MNTSNFKFMLDLQSTQSQIAIPVTRGDTARTWLISFRDGSTPYNLTDGCLAKLEILRPTGTHIEEFCPIEHNTTVRYFFSQNKNTAAVEGFHECAVVLYDEEGNIIGSPRFSMIVSPRVINSDNIKLSDETKLSVDSMITEEASRRNAEVARVNAESERISAEATRAESEAQRTLNEAARQTADSERALSEESRSKRFEALQKEIDTAAATLVSPTVTVTPTENGHHVKVTDYKGEHTFSLMNGKDGAQGIQGPSGKTAYEYAKGNGYTGTEENYAEDMTPDTLKNQLNDFLVTELAKRGQLKPEFANSIEECTDTSKLYVLPDGYIWAYMKKTSVVDGGPLFTNAIDEAGITLNKRWSHSSKALTDANGYITTGLIPVKAEQTVYVNRSFKEPNTTFNSGYSRCQYYKSDGNYITGEFDRQMNNKIVITYHQEDGVSTFVVGRWMGTAGDTSTDAPCEGASEIAYMRLVLYSGTNSQITEADVANLIISVGNPIEYSEPSTVVTTDWTNTGHAFVPADYEGRIIAIEHMQGEQSGDILQLQNRLTNIENNGVVSDKTESAALERIKKWDKPVYDSAPITLLSDDRTKPALTTTDRTIEAIYAKYRALMAANPRYITEKNLGNSTVNTINAPNYAGHEMLCFEFKESDGLTSATYDPAHLHEAKPKIIFISGIHTEWVGVWGLYYALEEITTNPEFDDVRRNAHIIVVPCANPFCLSNQAIEGWRTSHVNANGVAIHNNFNVDHSISGTVGEYNYGGVSPCSELETQYIDKIMADNPDAVAFVSCHNNDYSTEFGTPVIWASSATYHMCNIAFRLIDKISKAWINKYGTVLVSSIDTIRAAFPSLKEDDYRLGRATMSTSKGTEQKNAIKYGIQGVNLEIARMMKVFSGNTDGTSEVMTRGAEVYANLMRTLLSTYDHKDKKEYAANLPWNR